MKIGITGANGYIGSYLVKSFSSDHDVYSFVRVPKHINEIGFDLNRIDNEMPGNLDWLIHLAYDFSAKDPVESRRINVDNTIAFLKKAIERKTKVIFISSMSSYQNAYSDYGMNKYSVEKFCIENECIIVRPGLVFGEDLNQTGIYSKLEKIVTTHFFVPYPYLRKSLQFPCSVDQLKNALKKIIESGTQEYIGKAISVCEPKGYTLSELLMKIAAKANRKIILIPIPVSLVFLGISIVEKVFKKSPFKKDSLVGLMKSNNSPENLFTY